MSLDLRLYVVTGRSGYDLFAGTVMQVEATREVLESLKQELPADRMPGEFLKSWTADGWKLIAVDAYGERITFTNAGVLAKALRLLAETWEARAAAAYLDMVPAHTLVALYWH